MGRWAADRFSAAAGGVCLPLLLQVTDPSQAVGFPESLKQQSVRG